MRFTAQYSFKNGLEVVSTRYPHLFAEIKEAVRAVDISEPKPNKEKTNARLLPYNSITLNKAFQQELYAKGWKALIVDCEYPTTRFLEDTKIRSNLKGAFRDMDFVKDGLGMEVQLGKPPLEVCSVCAKMTIFRNLGFMECGIEIVPVKALALEMSSGVSYFEQFVWDLESRGVADIDIPVLILGIDA